MAGPLVTHPMTKTFDELQRSLKRMEIYLDQNFSILSDDAKQSVYIMIEGMKKALDQIPEEHRLTKHHYSK